MRQTPQWCPTRKGAPGCKCQTQVSLPIGPSSRGIATNLYYDLCDAAAMAIMGFEGAQTDMFWTRPQACRLALDIAVALDDKHKTFICPEFGRIWGSPSSAPAKVKDRPKSISHRGILSSKLHIFHVRY